MGQARPDDLSADRSMVTKAKLDRIGRSLAAMRLHLDSDGRLIPFVPAFDSDGTELIVHDKSTGAGVPLRVVTQTQIDSTDNEIVAFDIRSGPQTPNLPARLLAVLLDPDSIYVRQAWLISTATLNAGRPNEETDLRITPSAAATGHDMNTPYRHADMRSVARYIVRILELH